MPYYYEADGSLLSGSISGLRLSRTERSCLAWGPALVELQVGACLHCICWKDKPLVNNWHFSKTSGGNASRRIASRAGCPFFQSWMESNLRWEIRTFTRRLVSALAPWFSTCATPKDLVCSPAPTLAGGITWHADEPFFLFASPGSALNPAGVARHFSSLNGRLWWWPRGAPLPSLVRLLRYKNILSCSHLEYFAAWK